MNKEEFIYELTDGNTQTLWYRSIKALEKFFESNVCIPKGANRHIDADVLHEWLENTNKELKLFDGEYWRDLYSLPIKYTVVNTEYRIKLSEPVYEWQWVYGKRGAMNRLCKISDHCTECELEDLFNDDKDVYFYHPIDETRRER